MSAAADRLQAALRTVRLESERSLFIESILAVGQAAWHDEDYHNIPGCDSLPKKVICVDTFVKELFGEWKKAAHKTTQSTRRTRFDIVARHKHRQFWYGAKGVQR